MRMRSTSDRVSRAGDGARMTVRTITSVTLLAPKNATATIATTISGTASAKSSTLATPRPAAPNNPLLPSPIPANNPIKMPKIVVRTVTVVAISRSTRAAVMVREKTSIPAESVPNQCAAPGLSSGGPTTSVAL